MVFSDRAYIHFLRAAEAERSLYVFASPRPDQGSQNAPIVVVVGSAPKTPDEPVSCGATGKGTVYL